MAEVAERKAGVTDARRSLYDAGLSDIAIGKAVGVTHHAILKWRKCHALPANPQARLEGGARAQRVLLYQLGWSDEAISRHMRCTKQAVWKWRVRASLPPNFARGVQQRRNQRPSLDDVFARIRKAIGSRLPRDIADDAIMDLCAAILDGTIPLADIEREARKYGNRVLDRFANKWGARSLDEELGDDDGFRMIDMIRDERSSSWLEDMGATAW